MPDYKEQIKQLLSEPERLLRKKPFFRGYDMNSCARLYPTKVDINETVKVELPAIKKRVIHQSEFLKELEPLNHRVLYDQNVPSITMKLDKEQGGGFVEIKYQKMAVPFQKKIKDKQVQHLCGNKMEFTIVDENPTDQQQQDFITFKQYWDLRNQDGMKRKLADAQLSVGDAGLLYYFDQNKQIKSRLISYMDGFVLIPHNDENGDRIMEAVYYPKDDVEYIDCYDKENLYRFIRDDYAVDTNKYGWRLVETKSHGFSEIPLVTKRGDVAWNDGQSIIESYEILYNIFNVIQKRHGWGILYIKGRFDETGKKIAGSVILNDKTAGTDASGNDAKFLTPPSPQGTIDTLQLMEETIQKATSTTFLLPKDVKMTGDISGIAIMLTQSMDIEKGLEHAAEYQNVADKMCRLFKEGLAKELVYKKIQPTAITDFENLKINAKFVVWRPQSETDLVQRLATGISTGMISKDTATEKNPDSKPDEKARLEKQKEKEIADQERQLEITSKYSNKNNDKEE